MEIAPMILTSSPRLALTALAILGASLLSTPSSATAETPDKRTLTLTATGTVKTTPDTVSITTGVTSEGSTARAALNKNTDAMTKVVEGLKGAGIEPKDVQTTNFSISPVYEKKKQSDTATIAGYRVTNQVRIVVRDVKKLGNILDETVSLGANKINAIQFAVAEPDPLKDEARKDAVRKATAKAKLYAEAAGVSLGPVLTINEMSGGYVPRHMEISAAAPMAKDVPIEAGTTAVHVQVQMTWEIE